MRRSADARGKCKYVKARPEFSYSRCPPRHSPRPSSPPPIASRLLDATASPLASPPSSLRADRLRACASTCALDDDTHVRRVHRQARNSRAACACVRVCDTFSENVKIARARIESDSLSSRAQPPSAENGFFSVAFVVEKENTRASERARARPVDQDRSSVV